MSTSSKRKADASLRTCGVCCDEFTKCTRKPVECALCEFSACTECYKRFLSTKIHGECMKCQHPFDREFLTANFPKAWINGAYTKHRQDILVDMEMARMPTSQHLLVNYRIAKELEDGRRLDAILEKDLKAQLVATRTRREQNYWRLDRIRRTLYETDGTQRRDASTPSRAAAAPSTTVHACPVSECRGFLNDELQCGVCSAYACDKCWETRDTEHECNPDAVETAKYLRTKTRPCPKCHISVSKVNGCDQVRPTCNVPHDALHRSLAATRCCRCFASRARPLTAGRQARS